MVGTVGRVDFRLVSPGEQPTISAAGTFSEDREAGSESLAALHALVDRHPGMDVRLGHQR